MGHNPDVLCGLVEADPYGESRSAVVGDSVLEVISAVYHAIRDVSFLLRGILHPSDENGLISRDSHINGVQLEGELARTLLFWAKFGLDIEHPIREWKYELLGSKFKNGI